MLHINICILNYHVKNSKGGESLKRINAFSRKPTVLLTNTSLADPRYVFNKAGINFPQL